MRAYFKYLWWAITGKPSAEDKRPLVHMSSDVYLLDKALIGAGLLSLCLEYKARLGVDLWYEARYFPDPNHYVTSFEKDVDCKRCLCLMTMDKQRVRHWMITSNLLPTAERSDNPFEELKKPETSVKTIL